MYDLCVFTCIIFIFVFRCTHVQMSYVLNSYLLTYLLTSQLDVSPTRGDRVFVVAAAHVWNRLPTDVTT